MASFFGTSQAPSFDENDLKEIEQRHGDDYDYDGVNIDEGRLAKVYVNHLCRILRVNSSLDRNEWHQLREWAREVPDLAQQLKTDLFRLLKAVEVHDGGE